MPAAESIAKLFARGKALPWARIYFLSEWAYRKGRAAHGGLSGARALRARATADEVQGPPPESHRA